MRVAVFSYFCIVNKQPKTKANEQCESATGGLPAASVAPGDHVRPACVVGVRIGYDDISGCRSTRFHLYV